MNTPHAHILTTKPQKLSSICTYRDPKVLELALRICKLAPAIVGKDGMGDEAGRTHGAAESHCLGTLQQSAARLHQVVNYDDVAPEALQDHQKHRMHSTPTARPPKWSQPA
jgi:hypothetical protein